MKKTFCVALFCLTMSMPKMLYSQVDDSEGVSHTSKGPENGSLLIIGGDVNDVIWDKFKNLMGGAEKSLVVIPTAINDDTLSKKFLDDYREHFRNLGFQNVTVLHTRDKAVANTASFVEPLKSASGVWFSGGRQWRHADAYLSTKTHEAFNELLERGGVIAGNSAGATIQGSYLARGDTRNSTIMNGDHEEGLGFMKNVAIDQHLLARNRQFDMFEILDVHPELLGIGVDENNTAIVVHGNRFKVLGESFVAIYDGTRWSKERDTIYKLPEGSREFYFLSSGDEYDLENRRVVEYQDRIFIALTKTEKEKIVGRYESDVIGRIEFYVENDTLKAHQEWDDTRYPLYAESPKRLFIPQTDICFEFEFNKDGYAIELRVPIVAETFIKLDE